jgi:hypothetical protein
MSQHVWHSDLGAVEGDLKPWLKVLDKAIASDNILKGESRAMLEKAMQKADEIIGHSVKASDLLRSAVFKDRRSASTPEAEDVVFTMFLWQAN